MIVAAAVTPSVQRRIRQISPVRAAVVVVVCSERDARFRRIFLDQSHVVLRRCLPIPVKLANGEEKGEASGVLDGGGKWRQKGNRWSAFQPPRRM